MGLTVAETVELNVEEGAEEIVQVRLGVGDPLTVLIPGRVVFSVKVGGDVLHHLPGGPPVTPSTSKMVGIPSRRQCRGEHGFEHQHLIAVASVHDGGQADWQIAHPPFRQAIDARQTRSGIPLPQTS